MVSGDDWISFNELCAFQEKSIAIWKFGLRPIGLLRKRAWFEMAFLGKCLKTAKWSGYKCWQLRPVDEQSPTIK